MNTYYILSDGFDPIYEGHIDMGLAAVKKSDGVIVLVSSNTWLLRKRGKALQFQHFLAIVDEIYKK